MKHNWVIIDEGIAGFLNGPLRRCANCGSEQRRTTEYAWMRVTGYRWLPLVGRCGTRATGKDS